MQTKTLVKGVMLRLSLHKDNSYVNKLSLQKRKQIVQALVEGNSLRSTARMSQVSLTTVMKLLVDLGKVCGQYHHNVMRKLQCKHLQCDEIWAFCYAKEKNVPFNMRFKVGAGSVWTWIAICSDSKAVISWCLGNRDLATAKVFIKDVTSRLSQRVQIVTDGLKAYLEAIEHTLGVDVDYAQLEKIYGTTEEDGRHRYLGARRKSLIGQPDAARITTSHVERQNLTMRMGMRRFTRKTNAFSKKLENMQAAVNLHFMYYNFCRIHQTLRITPAMELGVSDRVWDIEDLIGLLN